MNLLTKKKFSKLCGIETKALAVYIKRGKVVVNGDFIDSDNPINLYFFETREIKNENKSVPEKSGEDKLNERASSNVKEINTKFEYPAEAPASSAYLMDNKIKEQELEKNKLQTKLLEVKLDKVIGDSIPTELVRNLMLAHSKSITVSFKNGLENWLKVISKKLNISIEDVAAFRAELIPIINTAVNDAIDGSKKGIKNIVDEHSQRKDVGERDNTI